MKKLLSLLLAVILILPACTTQKGGENMANMLYNGVELPDINTVWTDKETYPYASIVLWDYPDYGVYQHALYLSSVQYSYADNEVQFNASGNWVELIVENEQWVQNDSGTSQLFLAQGDTRKMVWSSVDVPNSADGSVYLAASTPVPVGGSKLTISTGGGEVLFDGSVTTKSTGSEAVYSESVDLGVCVGDVLTINFNGVSYTDVAYSISDYEIGVGSNDNDYTDFPFFLQFLKDVAQGWYLFTPNEGTYTLKISKRNGASLVYYEGTEPCAYSSAFGAYISGELLNEPGPSVGDTVYVVWDGQVYEDVVTTAEAFGNAPMFGDLTLATRPYVIGYMDINGDGTPGWFFATDTSGDHTLKVFSLVEGGEVTDTTATVNFSCKDLLYTDSVYRIKAWVYQPTGYSYGGVELPLLPEYDKAAYPHVAIAYVAPYNTYAIMCTSGLTKINSDGNILVATEDLTTYEFMLSADGATWEYSGSYSFAANASVIALSVATPKWANYDILNADDTTYLAASDPVPSPPDVSQPATWTSDLFAGPSHSESHTFTGLTPATDYAVYSVIWLENENAASASNATATFTTLEGEGLDFSNATLEVTKTQPYPTHAAFELTYTGLPGTAEVFDIVGTLDDGSEIIMGGKASSGSASLYATTGALEQNTEYTATFEVYHNGTPTGVKATTTFITLKEEGGFDRDAFLLGLASGLGGTGATKSGANHNHWAQGYVVGDELRKALGQADAQHNAE